MSDSEDMKRAIALSLLEHSDNEQDDLKEAIAASLGKTVSQLTARDLLMADYDSQKSKRTQKRPPAVDLTQDSNKRIKTPTRFWEGTVKLTYIKGFHGPDYITLPEIIQKTDLQKSLVTAFVVSMEFIEQQFPKDKNMCIVTHGRPALRRQLDQHKLLIMPHLKDDRYGCFHSKLMLLFHHNSVRVVIGSANMVQYDYEEMENVVFIQDFPLRSTPPPSATELPRFARDIINMLDEMQVPASVKDELVKYDFSKAKAHIITSISGTFLGKNEYSKYGHARLAEIVNEMGAEAKPKVEMQTSSLGALNIQYLNELYLSFSGKNYTHTQKPSKAKPREIPPISIIFPSLDTVESSRDGPSGASTICLDKKTWHKDTFPKDVMHDAISHRQGTLMHSKYIIATLPEEIRNKDKDGIQGWIYCGSHNATQSAWGKMTVTRGNAEPKMNISNWELGVVFPLYKNTSIPAPYLRPPPKYSVNQSAWTQDMQPLR
ncbi:phospholipase D/nuclease [Backusella circina FSU 941]|nr:phospholipase D/nuclease [Backusella circina FSU 941]